MDLREVGMEDVYWIQLAQNKDLLWALVNTVMIFFTKGMDFLY
jgi:hypothetical protein